MLTLRVQLRYCQVRGHSRGAHCTKRCPQHASDPIEPLLDVSRAAYLLGISVKTLRDWIQGRRIDYVKVGTRVMIRPETIRQFVTSNTRRAAG
jgi:excisionase family DNA binding protein